jgi:hypothetical protein
VLSDEPNAGIGLPLLFSDPSNKRSNFSEMARAACRQKALFLSLTSDTVSKWLTRTARLRRTSDRLIDESSLLLGSFEAS